MKVLITGATGFVGACLARRMIAEGHEIHVFTRRKSDTWRIRDIEKHLNSHEADLRDKSAVASAVQAILPDVILHCATYGGFAAQNDTSTIFEANIAGTLNLLAACANTGFRCFINTGSSSEYGLKSAPMDERDCLEPLGAYGVSKAAATLFCRSEAIERQLPIVTLRLFSPYGPWDDPRRLIPYAAASFLRGEQPKLADPHAVRDYIFIDDVVDAYVKVMKNPLAGEIINIGSGEQRAIGDVVTRLQSITRSASEPVWSSRKQSRPEPAIWAAKIDKADRMLAWRPVTRFQDGLERTAAWMKSRLHNYPSENGKLVL